MKKPTKEDLKKTYYVDEFYNEIEKPNPKKLGVKMQEPYWDCWYILHDQYSCPKEKQDPEAINNCPILNEELPCKEGRIKCIACIVPEEKFLTKQIELKF